MSVDIPKHEQVIIDRIGPVFQALPPVAEHRKALEEFLRQELHGAGWDQQSTTKAFQLVIEFDQEIWPHKVPSWFGAWQADAEGRFDEWVAEQLAEWERTQ